jgi:hypothetical protein
MGFIGLQSKNNLSGLPTDSAGQIFDNFLSASRHQNNYGSLYRFGSTVEQVKTNLSDPKLLTKNNIGTLTTFFDSSLPSDLTATTTTGTEN